MVNFQIATFQPQGVHFYPEETSSISYESFYL